MGILHKFCKDKRACVTAVRQGEKEEGTNVAVAIFSRGAIVFWLGGKNGKGGGLANPGSLSKPIQSAQLLGHAHLQEDAPSSPLPPNTNTET